MPTRTSPAVGAGAGLPPARHAGRKTDRNGLNWGVLASPAARLGTVQPCGTGRAPGAFPQSWCHG